MNTFLVISGLILVFMLGPRPRLTARPPASRVPANLSLLELENWQKSDEGQVVNLTEGAEASIQWATPDNPEKTRLCFLYLHGFSATRQETAPVTELLANKFDANTLHARINGHGVDSDGMLVAAETWLQSVVDAWAIATQLGDKVVIVGTSTGATLAVWLAQHQDICRDRLHALLFMSPNFKIRSPFGFLLTWPWSPRWVPWLIGKNHSWEPENELSAKYWTYSYSTLAVIEMQKLVDWVARLDLSLLQTPLAVMYMKNDPTINPETAVSRHHAWGAERKKLIRVTIDEDDPVHVFVGAITAPHRTDWCVNEFEQFLRSLEEPEHA